MIDQPFEQRVEAWLRADAATALVALYAALGGGWDATVIPQAPISNPEAR